MNQKMWEAESNALIMAFEGEQLSQKLKALRLEYWKREDQIVNKTLGQ